MTLGIKGGLKSKPFDFNQILSEDKQQSFLQTAAKIFQKHLINELEQTSLNQSQRQEIVHSISVQTTDNGGVKLLIMHPLAGQIEFGSRQFDEQPWMLRAQQNAQQELASQKG